MKINKLKYFLIGILLTVFILPSFPVVVHATHGINSWYFRVNVNGNEPFVLHGYESAFTGGPYLRLRDIAYILNGTRAQFNIHEDQIFRGRPYTPDGTELQPITERRYVLFGSMDGYLSSHRFPRSRSGRIRREAEPYQTVNFTMHWGWGISVVSEFGVIKDIDDTFFLLSELGYYLGFCVGSEIIEDYWTIVINTHEPNISEYGRRGAMAFLEQYPRYTGPEADFSYFFHDFTNDGIPVIFIHKTEILGDNRFHYMYVYMDGGYKQVGQIGSHDFFRDRQGQVFLFSLGPGMEDRLYLVIQSMTFTDTEVVFEHIHNGRASFFVPVLPGDDPWPELLRSLRPFFTLAACIDKYSYSYEEHVSYAPISEHIIPSEGTEFNALHADIRLWSFFAAVLILAITTFIFRNYMKTKQEGAS